MKFTTSTQEHFSQSPSEASTRNSCVGCTTSSRVCRGQVSQRRAEDGLQTSGRETTW
jgi:hypothetical protein